MNKADEESNQIETEVDLFEFFSFCLEQFLIFFNFKIVQQ